MSLEKTKELYDKHIYRKRERLPQLEKALQTHALQVDEIKDVESCIIRQFDIETDLKDIQERYKREANRIHNSKIVELTLVTISLSLASVFVAVCSILFNINYPDKFTNLNWLNVSSVIIFSLLITIVISMVLYVVIYRNWDRINKMLNR